MLDFDYLADPRDRAVFSAAPTLMQPSREPLPPCPYNTHRYVVARDGLYLQARTRSLSLCKRIATVTGGTLPYGALSEHVHLAGGRIPRALQQSIVEKARAALPNEWACLVLYDPAAGYRLHEPTAEARSAGHIRYQTAGVDFEQVVVDLHTHGYGAAFFSSVDDEDDRARGGIHISVVLGDCNQEHPAQKMRLVVHGHLIEVALDLWQAPGAFLPVEVS